MQANLPSVTVIVAARPEQGATRAVPSARALDYPKELLEIIVARGKQPSVQRNVALRAAKGDIIYFLDDDSVAQPGNLKRAIEHFRDAKVQIVGGPNLCPPDAPEIEQVFGLVLGSWLAFAASRARYTPVGKVRESSEKELILCNQLALRATLLKHGGFNEALYPNEENALMDDIQKAGGKLLYDPELFVYRRPRRDLPAFMRMLRTYGRGRAEQFRVNPTPGSAMNLVPPAFVIYLLTLPVVPFLIFIMPAIFIWLWYAILPVYLLVLLVQFFQFVPKAGMKRGGEATLLVGLTHVLYGYGFLHGLFTDLSKPPAEQAKSVTLEKVEQTAH